MKTIHYKNIIKQWDLKLLHRIKSRTLRVLILLSVLVVIPIYSTFAQNSDNIEIPGSITISGFRYSGAYNNRYTVSEDLNIINASGFTIFNLSDQNEALPIIRISELSNEEYSMLEMFKSITLRAGLEEAMNNRFISKKFKLIGYFPPADKLLINKNGFMYAIYSNITLYDMNDGYISPFPIWEGGDEGNNAYILTKNFNDFHGIRSQHIYDISAQDSLSLIATSNDFQIQFHHAKTYHNEEFFEGCENLAIHPRPGRKGKNEIGHKYQYFRENYSPQNDVNDHLKVENNMGYLSHYIVGFRVYMDIDNPNNLVLNIDSIQEDENISLGTGVMAIYPSTETGKFYINDYTGLYVFEKITTKDEPDSLMKDKESIILSSKNYPNPFNPKTTIEFVLFQDAYVSLKIYNALGEEVDTIAQGYLAKGKHRRIWDASDVASGIYFYHLNLSANSQQSPEFASRVDRLILVK